MTDQEYLIASTLNCGRSATEIAYLIHGSDPVTAWGRRLTRAAVYRMHRAGKLRVVGITATGGRPARLYALPKDVTL
jgi:hypothetical protein